MLRKIIKKYTKKLIFYYVFNSKKKIKNYTKKLVFYYVFNSKKKT